MRLPGIRAYVLVIVFALLGVIAPTQALAAAAGAPASAAQPDQTRPSTAQKEANRAQGTQTTAVKPAAVAPLSPTDTANLSSGPRREVFGYVYLNSSISDPTIGYPSWNFDLLTTVAVFGPHVNDDGTLSSTDISVWNGGSVSNLINTAHAHGTKVVATLTRTNSVCGPLINRATTVSQIVPLLQSRADGLSVDYEDSNQTCSNGQTIRSMLTDLVARLRASLPAGSAYLSISTYSGSASESYPCSDPSTCGMFDLRSLNSYIDAFMVMAYDMDGSNWSHAPLNCPKYCLGPNSPITGYYWNDTTVMNQYATVLPVSKVLLGIPYYGQGACVNSTAPNQVPASAYFVDNYLDMASIPTHSDVSNFQANRDQHDSVGLDPWDTWTDATHNCTREMYWDDVTSLGKKYDLVNNDNLRGIGIWTLGYGGGASELWNLIATHLANIPGYPGNVSACTGNGLGWVSWTAAPSPASPVTGYHVTANPGGTSVSMAANATTAVLTGLASGTAYSFTVQALNAYGMGLGSTVSASACPPQGSLQSVLPTLGNGAYGGYTTRLYIENTGSSAASVSILYQDSSGSIVGGDMTASLAPHGLWEIRQTNGDAFLPGDGGSGFVYSTQPVATFVNEFGPAGDPSSYTGLPAAGSATLYAPAIARDAFGGYTTGIGIVNLGTAAVSPTITYRDSSGQTVKIQNLASVPAGGYVGVYSGTTPGGLASDANLPDGFAGTASITAAGGQLAATVNEVGPGGAFGSYDAVPTGATAIFLPAIYNGAYGGYYTGVNVQNTSSAAGSVTVTYYDSQGAAVGNPITKAIAGNGYLALYSGDPAAGPPPSGSGYTARLSSTVALAATSNEVQGNLLTSYNGFTGSPSLQTLPLVENQGQDGWSTGVDVMNSGTSNAAVTVTFYNASSGAQIGQTSSTLGAGAFWGIYMPALGLPPAGQRATALVSASGGSIAVICNEAGPGQLMSYDGQ